MFCCHDSQIDSLSTGIGNVYMARTRENRGLCTASCILCFIVSPCFRLPINTALLQIGTMSTLRLVLY